MKLFRDRYRIVEYTHLLKYNFIGATVRCRVDYRPWYGMWKELFRTETVEDAKKRIDGIIMKTVVYYP